MTIEFKPQEGPQTQFAICEADVALYGGAAGGGKALDPEEPVMTPYGMVPIKDIKVGSKVMNPTGIPCTVIGVFPQEEVEMYLVTFSDGTQIKACEDHQWTVWNRFKNNSRATEMTPEQHPTSPWDLYPPSAKVIKTKELKQWVGRTYSPQVPITRPLILNTTYNRE